MREASQQQERTRGKAAKRVLDKHFFTKEEQKLIAELYPNMLTQEVADRLGLPIRKVYQYANRMGIYKSAEFLAAETQRVGKALGCNEKAIAARFKPGQVSWNKGRKGICYSPETQFKKGNLPYNTKHDGAIVTRTDKRGKQYQFIRTSLGVWEALHVHVYKKEVGEVPEGHVVRFVDGNTLNCDPSNLVAVSRKDNMLYNSIMRYPKDVRVVMKTLGKLKKKINNDTKTE